MKAFSRDGVRPEVRSLRAYDLAKEGTGPLVAKLDFNESPYDVPDEIKDVVLSRLRERSWSRYPVFGAPRLKAAIAIAISRRPEEVVAGNGSGELLLAAISVFAGGGSGSLALAVPTFSLYGQMAAIAGARRVDVPRCGDEFAVDEAAFLAACEDGRTVPLLCSPNNPTGGVVSLAFVKRLAEAAPVVLLDQAYVDFARPEDDALPLLDTLPNLVVFRTLSKAYSAAGFRIGYAAASAELARELRKAVLPFSVDHAAEELALALLERRSTFANTVATISRERERVATGLRSLGFHVATSLANFLFVAPPVEAGGLRAMLLSRGILVRDMTAVVANRLRVTIGAPEENDALLSALKETLR